MNKKQNEINTTGKDKNLNGQLEGNDKAPGEEKGKQEKVTNEDLKGKKVDADPSEKKDQSSH